MLKTTKQMEEYVESVHKSWKEARTDGATDADLTKAAGEIARQSQEKKRKALEEGREKAKVAMRSKRSNDAYKLG